jgi:hypothetical protein
VSGAFSKITAGVVYFAIATLLAQVALVAIGVSQGALTKAKLNRIRDILHSPDESATASGSSELEVEMPSYEEILAARAVEFRTLEMREEIVRQNVNLINRERLELTSKRDEFDRAQQAFEQKLSEMESEALLAGEENVRETIATMKPQQAKQQIMLMLERGEMEKVVALLAAMPTTKRAKVVAEFQTADDAARLNEILERMGEGEPLAQIVDQARAATAPNSTQR